MTGKYLPQAELRVLYEAAVRKERTAWAALSAARDTDASYAALLSNWREAALEVSKLAVDMRAGGA
jgi:hypothetical protein